MLAHGVVAAVKIRRDFRGLGHNDIPGQKAVDGVTDMLRGDAPLQKEGGTLSLGVNAGVGAAGAQNLHLVTGDPRECFV